MSDEFEYDPEKALWKPGRRGFLSLFGCAVASAFLPSLPDKTLGISGWVKDGPILKSEWKIITSDLVTKENALDYVNSLKFAGKFDRPYANQFQGTSVGGTVKVRMPQRFHV